jgi:hypothetical protein
MLAQVVKQRGGAMRAVVVAPRDDVGELRLVVYQVAPVR